MDQLLYHEKFKDFNLNFLFHVLQSEGHHDIVMPLIEARMKTEYPTELKRSPVVYTTARTKAARDNIRRYPWAKQIAGAAVREADLYLKRPLAELARELPSPSMPRGWNNYCPHCEWWSHAHGVALNIATRPWQMTCPACGGDMPGFDALKFYHSGRDKLGWFHWHKADHSLLPKDPAFRKRAVDSMWAYVRGHLSAGITKAIVSTSDAHVYTAKKAYAVHACGLLVSLAYAYPYFRKEDCINGDTHPGTMLMDCHEASVINEATLAYDKIFSALSDPGLVRKMSALMAPYGIKFRNSRELKAFIEGRIFGVITWDMRRIWHGDGGELRNRDHFAYETIGAILNGTPLGKQFEQVAWELRSQGYAKDGSSRVGGLEYDMGCYRSNLQQFTRILKYCKNAPVDYFADPTVLAAANLYFDLHCIGRYYPNYGDAAYCGAAHPAGTHAWADTNEKRPFRAQAKSSACEYAQIFAATGIERFARIAWSINGSSVNGIRLGILDRDPEAIRTRVQKIVDRADTSLEPSFMAANLGLGILKAGRAKQGRALWMRTSEDHQFAEGGWHGHEDATSIGLMGYGLDLMPDVGYMDQKRWAFGHNLVSTQDSLLPKIDPGGNPHVWEDTVPRAILSKLAFIAEFPCGVQVMQGVGTQHPEMTRTVFLVDAGRDRFYVIDHVHIPESVQNRFVNYSFHSGQGKVKTNLRFVTHPETLTGESRMSGKWLAPTRTVAAKDRGKLLWADIAIEDTYGLLPGKCDVRLRFASLRPVAHIFETAYMPSQIKAIPGLPTRLPYFFLTEGRPRGKDKARRFSTLIEPYRKTRVVTSARVLDSGHPGTEIIEVREATGRTLHFVISNGKHAVALPDGSKVKGKAAVQVTDKNGVSLHTR